MAEAKKVTVLDILKHARALLAKRGGWTIRTFARTKKNNPVLMDSPEAACFCASGALGRAEFELTGRLVVPYKGATREAVETIREASDIDDLVGFNDSQDTKRTVLRAFDKAIAKLEAKNA